jgi:hypothetical protein
MGTGRGDAEAPDERRPLTPVYVAASIVVGMAAYVAELWLLVLGIVGGWLRIGVGVADHRWRVQPQHVARTALDGGWRRTDWAAEHFIQRELAALAGQRLLVVRRARRLVARASDDLGRRAVALERLAALESGVMRERAAGRARLRDQLVVPGVVAAVAGAAALLALSDLTPGPTMTDPWRSGVGVVTAAATAVSFAASAHRSGR